MVLVFSCIFTGFLLIFPLTVSGLTCFSCKGIYHPRFCDLVERCTAGQSCSLAKFVKASGETTYDLGCSASDVCSGRTTKSLEHEECYSCCPSDLCNDAGCGDYRSNSTGGKLCYQCTGVLKMSECHTVMPCPENELCYIESTTKFGEMFYNSGCQTQHGCHERYNSNNIFGRREVITKPPCHQCCDKNICNFNCHSDITQPTLMTSTSAMTSMASMASTTSTNALSNQNEYFLMFLDNYSGSTVRFSVYTSTDSPSGIVSCWVYTQNFTNLYSLSNNDSHSFMPYFKMDTIGIEQKMIKMVCNVSTTVYGVNYGHRNTDGYLALPKISLGRKYVIPTFTDGAQLGIGAIYNNTIINIHFNFSSAQSFTYNGQKYHVPGDNFTVQLSERDTFFFTPASSDVDMTGTLITSNQPISVVSGARWTRINNECCNHMTEMILPYEQQGREFIIPNLYQSMCEYRVLSYVKNEVNIHDGKNTRNIQLNPGSWYSNITPN